MQDRVERELIRLRNWSLEDLQTLSEGLEVMIRQQASAKSLCDLRKFRGIGHGTWTDAGGINEFIEQERAS